jgi:FlaA1/EpsC-like NDP-sugar epimerase
MGDGGEIYVLDMGRPVNIKDIAYELIRLSGLEPEKDISIEYIGSRPGEKMFEELKTNEENIIETNHEKIMMMKNGSGYNWAHMLKEVSNIMNSAKSYDTRKIILSLIKFIPEYSPDKNFVNLKIKKSSIIEQ